MDALRLRARGRRTAPPPPTAAADRGDGTQLNRSQMQALQSMFTSSPIIGAVRTILHHQLVNGGICLRRNGQLVPTTPAFQRHLSTHWRRFSSDCIDALFTYGLVVVAVDQDEHLAREQRRQLRRLGPVPPAYSPLVVPMECIDISMRSGGRAGYVREYVVHTTTGRLDPDARGAR